jgi:hypothetical protein
MADDFRVTVTFDDPATAGRLGDRLQAHKVEDEARTRLGGRVSVSSDGPRVFLYANSAAAAQEAEQAVRAILDQDGFQADFALDRWHPIEEQWEDGSQPMPVSASERDAERDRREADEEAESQASGFADWEVRVDMPTHREAVALAERLKAEGREPIRRWKYVIVGANTEDEAHELAKTIRAEAAEARVAVEPALGMVGDAADGSPFAIFG